MAEWPIALVLKTRGPKGSVSSTLTSSAICWPLAQMVEHCAVNAGVHGSIP